MSKARACEGAPLPLSGAWAIGEHGRAPSEILSETNRLYSTCAGCQGGGLAARGGRWSIATAPR